jgi:putative peptidoglycan lipid II flippase
MAKKVEKQAHNEIEARETSGVSGNAQAQEPGVDLSGPSECAWGGGRTEQAHPDPSVAAVLSIGEGARVDAAGQEPLVMHEPGEVPRAAERRHLVRSAALVSLGNLGSSLMGMVRQIIVTWLGASIAGPFNAALTPANNFFQLLINGSVSGALVPTFNDYAAPARRQEMRRVVFTVLNLILLVALLASIGYALIAPWFVNVLVPGYSQQADKMLTLHYSQIIFFSLVALGPFAVLLSALFALKEFGWPAFATAAYHAGIILGAIGLMLLGPFPFGKIALPVGVLLGALGEIALLLPAIRRQRFAYLFVLDLKHPVLRRIIKLYLPIMVSFAFTTALVFLDVSLWTRAPGYGPANTVAQTTATALLQFPVGLVAMALSFAVLPTLTEHAREGDDERFKATLLLGLRVGLLLMVPAMVGMWVLRLPIVYLLFAHHNNDLSHAGLTALALQNYVYQLPFVAVDQLLIAAFYARKNTLTPVVVGIVCIGFYLIVALPFFRTIGIPALALANTVQNSLHAVILLLLLRRAMGSLHMRTALPTLLKICLCSALMGLVAWGTMALLGRVELFSLTRLPGQLLTVIVAGGLACVVYFGAILLLRVEEIDLIKAAILAKLGRR